MGILHREEAVGLQICVHPSLREADGANPQSGRLSLRKLPVFGGLALLLVCVGLYGVMSYAVVRRTREIGIRMALDAQPGTVRRQVLRETLWLVAGGVSIGVPAALASARLVSGLLCSGSRPAIR
jgi:hypothetical protein